MYRTVSNDFTPDEPFDYDMLIFFSPAGIKSLTKNFPDFDQDKEEVAIGCFGLNTAKAVRDAGLRLDVEAPTSKYHSMTAALTALNPALRSCKDIIVFVCAGSCGDIARRLQPMPPRSCNTHPPRPYQAPKPGTASP